MKPTFSTLLVFRILFISVLIVVSKNGFARCNVFKAGATDINYKLANDNIYATLEKDKILINALDGKKDNFLSESLPGSYDINYSGKKCGKANIEVSFPGIEEAKRMTEEANERRKKEGDDSEVGPIAWDGMDDPLIVLKDLTCEIVSSDKKYIIINKKEKVITVGSKLKIRETQKVSNNHEKIKKLILRTKIYAGRSEEMIDISDIVNIDSFPVFTTELGAGFTLITAQLDLKNVLKYFKNTGYRNYGDKYKKLTNIKIGVPILFFSSAENIKLIADPSNCTDTQVMQEHIQLFDRIERNDVADMKDSNSLYDLGSLGEFRATGAFDMDGDGHVDIIVINDGFAIRVYDGFKFEIIDHPLNC